jgi:hypothetical protein
MFIPQFFYGIFNECSVNGRSNECAAAARRTALHSFMQHRAAQFYAGDDGAVYESAIFRGLPIKTG